MGTCFAEPDAGLALEPEPEPEPEPEAEAEAEAGAELAEPGETTAQPDSNTVTDAEEVALHD